VRQRPRGRGATDGRAEGDWLLGLFVARLWGDDAVLDWFWAEAGRPFIPPSPQRPPPLLRVSG